jgi:hypothetical protein
MKTFKEFIQEKRKINEMPQYIDHDYLPFTPVEDRTMQVLEARFDELEFYSPEGLKLPDDLKIYINKRKTMVFMGMTKFIEERGSWVLEVVTWIKLEKSPTSKDHHKVRGVHTREEITGKGYTLALYFSLFKNKIYLESDNEQYQGAKPLWKALSRLVQVEVHDEKENKIIHKKYDERKIQDSEIWSEDGKHFLKTLRVVYNG